MLGLFIKVSDIDYSAVSDKVMPMILERLSCKDNSGKLIKLLSRYSKLSKAAINTALALLHQNTKDEIAIHLIESYEDQLIMTLNGFMSNKELNIHFKSIEIKKTDLIELDFKIAAIDYCAVISKGYPTVMEKLKDNGKYEKLFGVMSKVDHISEKLIQATLNTLSQDEKDELTMGIINTYEEEILSLMNSLAQSNRIILTVEGMEIRKG